MQKPEILETKNFACIAEGVAHYYRLGYKSDDSHTGLGRIMHNSENKEVYIRNKTDKQGKPKLLDVIATVIQL